MDNPQDLNPASVKRAESEVKDSIDLESQDDIKQTSSYIIRELRRNLDVLEKKIDDGALDGYQRPNLTARRIGILDVVRGVIEKMTNNIKGGYNIDHDKGKVVDDEPLDPIPTPDPEDLGYGYGATHKRLDSVETDSSKLTESGYRVIKTKEDIASGMNHSAVEPDIEDDEQLIKAYHELVTSLVDRVEDTYEDKKEVDVQTGKDDSPAIKIKVLGYSITPHTKAAKQQEDSTSAALPPPDKIPGYESYMDHSTANPQRFG